MYKTRTSTSTTNPKDFSVNLEEDDEKSQLYREDFEKHLKKKKKEREKEREGKVPVLRLYRLPEDNPMICLHVDTGLRRSQFEKSGKLGRIDDTGQVGSV